jgi:hypothetical protein
VRRRATKPPRPPKLPSVEPTQQEIAMNPTLIATTLLVLAATAPVYAQQSDHRLGEHPAVIVKRLSQHQAYDYASKFYAHPARLYFSTEAPRPMVEHPAVTVFRRYQQEHENASAGTHPKVASRVGGPS